MGMMIMGHFDESDNEMDEPHNPRFRNDTTISSSSDESGFQHDLSEDHEDIDKIIEEEEEVEDDDDDRTPVVEFPPDESLGGACGGASKSGDGLEVGMNNNNGGMKVVDAPANGNQSSHHSESSFRARDVLECLQQAAAEMQLRRRRTESDNSTGNVQEVSPSTSASDTSGVCTSFEDHSDIEMSRMMAELDKAGDAQQERSGARKKAEHAMEDESEDDNDEDGPQLSYRELMQERLSALPIPHALKSYLAHYRY